MKYDLHLQYYIHEFIFFYTLTFVSMSIAISYLKETKYLYHCLVRVTVNQFNISYRIMISDLFHEKKTPKFYELKQ